MKNKIILWLIPLAILMFLNIFAFFGEMFMAGIDWEYALILRVSSITIDGLFVGIYTYIRIISRKKLRHKFGVTTTIYLSDTLAVLLVFYLLYLLRLILFLYLNWININSFLIDTIGGLLVAILFGWLLAYITSKSKKYIVKIKRKKKKWSFIFTFLCLIF